MFKATKVIYDAITARGLKATVQEDSKCSMVRVRFTINYSAPIEVLFMSTDDDNDVAVRVELMHVEEEKVEMLLPVLNDFNNRYRYGKFTLNSENDIYFEYDFPLRCSNVGECANELIARFMMIVKDAHPKLLQAALAPKPSALLS